MYYLAYRIGSIFLGTEPFGFDRFSELFAVDKALEFGWPLLVGCFILMNVGAVLGYFGVHLAWRSSVRNQQTFRKMRGKAFDSAFMASMSHGNYLKFLKKRNGENEE
jgi:uncharacterized protein (DUF2062 family)